MTLFSLGQLVISFALILLGAVVFINAVEWLGKALKLSQSAVGSVLAAIGTAMPETMIPVVALLTAGDADRSEVGIGAILGAPLLLATVAMGLMGLSLIIFSRRNGRPRYLLAETKYVRRDISFFLIAYAFAIFLALIDPGNFRAYAAILFVLLFAYFVWVTVRSGEHIEGHKVSPLYFSKKSETPSIWIIVIQLVAALGLLVGGAHSFVGAIESIAHAIGLPALLLSLIIAPLATELPEKFNSILWLRESKDTLALGNITGAMVFQSTLPVALGVAFTQWHLTGAALLSAVLSLGSGIILWFVFKPGRTVRPGPLLISGLLYLVFVSYVIFA